MKFNIATSAISVATMAASTTPVTATNFVIIQPDDMQFYNDWNPPPYLPWGNKYPGRDYPGTSTLPWINKLRDEGLEMTQAYAAAPKCGTSRYSTVTGRYATRSSHGRKKAVEDNLNPADASIPNTKLRNENTMDDGQDCGTSNIAQAFKANNYTTGMVGKWHLTKVNIAGGTVASVKATVEECGECIVSSIQYYSILRCICFHSLSIQFLKPQYHLVIIPILFCKGFMDVEAMYPDNLNVNQAWSAGIDHNMEYVAYKAVEHRHGEVIDSIVEKTNENNAIWYYHQALIRFW